MKYKQVFFIWLLADVFLIIGVLCFGLYELLSGGSIRDTEIFLLMVAIGILASLPSLLIMLLFHLIYSRNAKDTQNYRMPYIALIISINIVYYLISLFGYSITGEFKLLFMATTTAGLLAFYFVDRKIQKSLTVKKEELS